MDLTIAQTGHETTIVINPDGTCYFKDGDSYNPDWWFPAEIGNGIRFGGGDEQRSYYMNNSKNRMYWGLNNYMNQKDGYVVRKIK